MIAQRTTLLMSVNAGYSQTKKGTGVLKGSFLYGLIALILLFSPSIALADGQLQVDAPNITLNGVPFTIEVRVFANGTQDASRSDEIRFRGAYSVDGQKVFLKNGKATVKIVSDGEPVTISVSNQSQTLSNKSLPGLLSILPPLLAIILALTLRQVVVSLFAGIWLGAVFVFDYEIAGGFLRVLDHYIIQALANPDHVSIIAFSMLFGGMVGVISKNGGTGGIAKSFVTRAGTARRAQFGTWLLGLFIFFDDYANSLIVGNTMRPVTDKMRISREKLAYLVDSTAAPVSSLVLISTWVGYEVGLIDAALKSINYTADSAYLIFLQTIPYRFYPILSLVLVGIVIYSKRDMFSMYKAEMRARTQGKLYRDGASLATDLTDTTTINTTGDTPLRWYNAVIPIVVVVAGTMVGLYVTGMQGVAESGTGDYSLGSIVGNANSYQALLWASLLSCVVAIFLSVSQRILKLTEAMDAWFTGLKSMLLAMLILTLAWSIGQITLDLHTADYIVSLLLGRLDPHFLPVLTFIVAAIISFATGTSWGTMGILMPLVIPLSVALGLDAGYSASEIHTILLGTESSVLAGAVFGDHCSPISDTTILSSMASACDHVDHVRTQLPYALLAGIAGMLAGDIPSAYGLSPYISIVVGAGVVVGLVYIFGKKVPPATAI
jgi:Na+/H+ antiporter NhaC